MKEPHVLIIPPWFDIGYSDFFAKSYHEWAQDLSDRGDVRAGLLYGEFTSRKYNREFVQKDDLNYHYLGVKGWGLPKIGPGWYIWKRQYLKAYEEYVRRYNRPTVIHGFSLLGLIAAAAIHRQSRVPLVYTEVLGSFISGDVAKRLSRQGRKAVRGASVVCGISPGMVTALEEDLGVSAELIPLYVDGGIFYPKPQRDGPPQFISIGAPAITKGFDVLMEAMALVVCELPDAQLILADDIPEQSWLETLVANHKLGEHVRFIGAMQHHSIPEYLHNAHVLVSASRMESLGMTMLEALSCGRPVVATDTPGGQYIVKNDMGVIVPKENPEQLAKAMVQVYQNRLSYDPVDLHERIQTQFGKDGILGQWEDIYYRASNTSI